MSLSDHVISAVVVDPHDHSRIFKCSCGDEWTVTANDFAIGANGYDAHVKAKTGKFPNAHD
jgi:hypothetical protein